MSNGLLSFNGQIQNPKSKIFRRCYIKRRNRGSGLYEDEWQEVTKDVIKWGSIKKEVDAQRVNVFKFSGLSMSFSNHDGKYNPSDDENSMWYGYGDQQRTLVKIQIGFLREVEENGIWSNIELPSDPLWDQAFWDVEGTNWDNEQNTFVGFISGDINIAGTNEIRIPIVSMTECFRQFPARRLTGWNDSLTASDFMEMLRDQVDDTGAYIFRPFFQNTTTGWDIQTTTVEYANLNTSTAKDVYDATTWDIIEKLAGAENCVPLVTTDGKFKFMSRTANTDPTFHFFGSGIFSSEYGTTIKKIGWFGKRFTKYYSRVSLRYREADTVTSFVVHESTFRVSGDSSPWTLGERTLEYTNVWIPTLTVAENIASELFLEYSAIRPEIEFATSLVPHLNLLDVVQISHDSTEPTANSLWDLYDWADNTDRPMDLYFDGSGGDALKLTSREFRLISIEINLDSGECKFVGRE